MTVFNAGEPWAGVPEPPPGIQEGNPGVTTAQESSGSLEAARKVDRAGQDPDVLAVADYAIIPKLLIPDFADWYATFATNALRAGLSRTSRRVRARSTPELVPHPAARMASAPAGRIRRSTRRDIAP